MGEPADYDHTSDDGRTHNALLTLLEEATIVPCVIEECGYCFGNGDEGYVVVRVSAETDADHRHLTIQLSPEVGDECWAHSEDALSAAIHLNAGLARAAALPLPEGVGTR